MSGDMNVACRALLHVDVVAAVVVLRVWVAFLGSVHANAGRGQGVCCCRVALERQLVLRFAS